MKKFLWMMIILCASTVWAAEGAETTKKECSLTCKWWCNIKTTWRDGEIEGFLPVNTWHNRWVYDHDKAHSYNERPWGAGIGKYRYDADGDRHRLVAMVFQDSHNKPEPSFAYSWQYLFRKEKTFRPSLGFMAGITFRDDYNWLPIPAVLPAFGFDIGNFSVENTYIPGLGGNNGHVLFTWVSWRF